MIPSVPATQVERLLAQANQRRIWLHAGAMIDGVSSRAVRDAHVVFDKDQIWFAGENSPPVTLVNLGQHKPDLELPCHTILPGLIEAHAHLFLEGGELAPEKRASYLKQEPEALLAAAKLRLEKLLRLGIAGIRDAGDKDGVGLALSRWYRSAHRPVMPYLDSPGAAIHRKGRYGGFMAEALENHASPDACVEARVRAGADRIKLIPTGIINFKSGQVTTAPQMSAAEVEELVRAARARNKQTFAHASGDTGIDHAIDGGVDSIEHGFFMRHDQLARMRDRQTAWVPTFAPVYKQVEHAERMGWSEEVLGHLKRILDQHAASVRYARDLGVLVIAGSDAGSCGVAHGLGFLEELELMEGAGLAPLEVINAATGTSATRLGFGEKCGILKPGYRSRFILTAHDPLEKIANLRKSRHIVFDGSVFKTDATMDCSGL